MKLSFLDVNHTPTCADLTVAACEGTEMMDSQLMGEFECDIRDLEADSWSGTVDKKFLKTLKKDEVKRQDVIYGKMCCDSWFEELCVCESCRPVHALLLSTELYQTEFHHVRTLKIMSEVYYKGLQREMQLDTQTLDKVSGELGASGVATEK